MKAKTLAISATLLSQIYAQLYALESQNVETHELERVTVSANKGAQIGLSSLPLELQSRQISIVSKDTLLEKISLGGAQAALESVPSVLYSRSGGVNGQISVRGQNSNNGYTLIMIDGVPFTGRSTLDFNVLDVSQFDSIEVIRGSAGSLYGNYGINGLINFRSRKSNYNLGGKDFKATARLRSLEYQSVNNGVAGRAEILGGGGGWDLLVGASGRIGGDYLTPIQEGGKYLKTKNSNYNAFNLDFNVGYTTKSNTRYYAQGRYSSIESHRAGGGAGVSAAPGSSYGIYVSEIPLREYYLRLGALKKNLSFANSMDIYTYIRHWDTDIWNYRSNSTYGTSRTNIQQQVYNNNIAGFKIIFDSTAGKHSLGYGGEIVSAINPRGTRQIFHNGNGTNATGSVNIDARPSTNTDFALFLKDDWKVFDRWILSGAIRGDYFLSTVGKERMSSENSNASNGTQAALTKQLDDNDILHSGAITGSLGSVWFITDYISNVINLSHNFKDSYSYRYSVSAGTPPTMINPTLHPEYSQTAELGFRVHTDNHYASLVGFFTYYHDKIALGATYYDSILNTNARKYQNIGKAYIAGAELEGRHSFLDSMIELGYVLAYNYGMDISNHKPIAYIAPLYGNISVKFNFDRVYLGIVQRFYADKWRIDNTQERRSKGYMMSDIYAGVKLGAFKSYMKDMELIFGVSNLFNTIGRNPVVFEEINAPYSITNPLVEPARNFTLKYVWKY
ncbi:TonB-dependent receptor [Helicobacter sp. MIT 01-3238]|uniref:TonB-dependent receptor n=1 Tax=Helicobacter sp. MIT 01-3238 TaxID=398627 RepID=UPI000E1E69E7|nr:TonB-dependent receptor [Helicobacter sp. MIT 01-3238]RDU54936.1 TonB-dependent receptor [Helicobacter sp. MIT 01-3238]